MPRKILAEIVGRNNILDEPKILEQYSSDVSFIPGMKPVYVVKPGNAEEVKGIVKWANETLTPLVPISSGPPHFHGGTLPGAAGSVVVDLGRMKRIIRVDPLNKVAMVEPGVTFGEIQAELEKAGMCAYMPLAPRSTKSVIGSMLEREPITMPSHHWDSVDPMLCVEIVFGTGDTLRTGEAGGPDTIEEQWEIGKAQMSPFGPNQMDVNRLVSGAQGTIGIITWATLKCRYLSKLNQAFLVPSENVESLIGLNYELLRIRLGDNLFILNGQNLAYLLGHTAREVKNLKKKLPSWFLFINFEGYGQLPEDKVQYQKADFLDMAQARGLNPVAETFGVSAAGIHQLLSGPSLGPYWKLKHQGGCHDIFFLTTLDKTPGFAAAMTGLAQKYRQAVEDIGIYIQPAVQGTCCHCEFNLYYDPTNAADVDKTRKLLNEGVEKMVEMGAFFSRPYGAWADAAYRQHADVVNIQRKIKKIFDPKNILNPGKLCF